ncbi:MFS transporter [Kitasatospora indigofera]|uniref:MFS transporter n=1 Tax=Kitasatospora indigofera TaxID=67307 RepID=UPI00362E77AC
MDVSPRGDARSGRRPAVRPCRTSAGLRRPVHQSGPDGARRTGPPAWCRAPPTGVAAGPGGWAVLPPGGAGTRRRGRHRRIADGGRREPTVAGNRARAVRDRAVQDGAVRDGAVRTGAVRAGAFVSVAVALFCIQLDFFALNLAVPGMAAELDVTVSAGQWTLSAYMLAIGCFFIVGGRLGDVFGRRPVLLAGTALFAAASVGCALAPDLAVLVMARSSWRPRCSFCSSAGGWPPGAWSRRCRYGPGAEYSPSGAPDAGRPRRRTAGQRGRWTTRCRRRTADGVCDRPAAGYGASHSV